MANLKTTILTKAKPQNKKEKNNNGGSTLARVSNNCSSSLDAVQSVSPDTYIQIS